MFSYNVFKSASNEEFKKVCKKIEKISGIKKEQPIIDVDGSIIQIYWQDSKKITVYNDYEIGAVYINSDIELGGFLDLGITLCDDKN